MSHNLFNKLSLVVESQLPEFVREDYPLFIRFIEAYYEFLEQKLNDDPTAKNDLYAKARQLQSISDVDESLNDFEEQFFNIFLELFPRDTEASKQLLIKNSIPFYKSKGNERSFKYFFRSLFNEEIDLFAPKDDVLIASGGKWKILRTLRTTRQVYSLKTGGGRVFSLALREIEYPQDPFVGQIYSIPGEPYSWNGSKWVKVGPSVISTIRVFVDDVQKTYITDFDFQREARKITFKTEVDANSVVKIFYDNFDHTLLRNRLITGSESDATSIIETSIAYSKNRVPIFEFEIAERTIQGEYIGGENLVTDVLLSEDEVLPIYLEPFSSLTSITIQNGGSAYNVGDPILISGGDPLIKANAQVSAVFSGFLNKIAVNYGGAGFKVGFPIIVTNVSPTSVTAVSSDIDTSGANSANSYVYVTNMIRDLAANTIVSANYKANNCFLGSSITTPNANSRLIDVFSYGTLTGIGPITEGIITFSDSPATRNPIIDAASSNVPITSFGGVASTFAAIRDLGSLGRIDVLNGGSGYVVGDKIKFENIQGVGFGVGARAAVTNVDTSGAIVKTQFQPFPPASWTDEYILGKSNVTADSVTITGTGTNYTANIFPTDVVKIVNGWRLENASYTGVSLNAAPIIGGAILRGVEANTSGTRLYILADAIGTGIDRIYQVELTRPWDISSAIIANTANANLASIASISGSSGLQFKDDGTRIYTTNSASVSNNRVYEFHLSTPWNITTLTAPTAANLNVTAQESEVRGVHIANNGYSMYVGGNDGDRIFQYYLSTPWQVNTASFVRSFDPPELADPRRVYFHPSGNTFFTLSALSIMDQYEVSQTWNVQTAIHTQNFTASSLTGDTSLYIDINFVSNGSILLMSTGASNTIYSINVENPFYRRVINVGSTTSFNVNTPIPAITSPEPVPFPVIRLERNSLDVSIEAGNNYVIGNRTFFTTDFKSGDEIMVFNQRRTIDKIQSNTSMNVTTNFTTSKTNTEVGLYNLYPIGGQGYSQSVLPITTVESTTGSGAQLVTTSIMGDGENISISSDKKPGEIISVEVTDFGSSYKFAPTLSLANYGDGTAVLIPFLESSYYEYPGLYQGTDGHLSSDKKIQDSILYNTGSYLIKTRQQFTKFRNALLNLLHPSGSYTYVEYTPIESLIIHRDEGSDVTISNVEITVS